MSDEPDGDLDAGDEITWRSHGPTTEGTVESKITDRRFSLMNWGHDPLK